MGHVIEAIRLGDNFRPPIVCKEATKNLYAIVRSDEFNVSKYNSLLMAVVTYLDSHGVDYNDGDLPWAESYIDH